MIRTVHDLLKKFDGIVSVISALLLLCWLLAFVQIEFYAYIVLGEFIFETMIVLSRPVIPELLPHHVVHFLMNRRFIGGTALVNAASVCRGSLLVFIIQIQAVLKTVGQLISILFPGRRRT